MVGVDRDRLDEFFDQDPSFLLVGMVPDRVEVERRIAEQRGGLLERLGERVPSALLLLGFGVVGFECLDLGGEALFLLAEVVARDLVVEVQREELLAFVAELGDRSGAGRCRVPASGSIARRPQLIADGFDEPIVGAKFVDAESGGAMETVGRPPGDTAALATVPAAVDPLPPVVRVDRGTSAADTTVDATRQQILPGSPDGAGSSLHDLEVGFADEWFVQSGVPVPGVARQAEIGLVRAGMADGRVLDAGCRLDGGVRHALDAQLEHAPHQRCVIVLYEDAVDEVVARGRPVDPVAGSGGLFAAHLRVLDCLLAEVLGEHAVDACLHPTRCGVDLDGSLVERVQVDAVFLEKSDDRAEVAAIAGEPVESPDDDVCDLVGADELEELLHGGPLEVLA